jgi:hypothetical protein
MIKALHENFAISLVPIWRQFKILRKLSKSGKFCSVRFHAQRVCLTVAALGAAARDKQTRSASYGVPAWASALR